MAPPASSTAHKVSNSRTAHQPARRSSRPPLRVLPARRRGARRNRLLRFTAVAMVVGALLVVVVGQAVLASGQVRLTAIDQQLGVEQGVHRQAELQVASLETPALIISTAVTQLHLVHPTQPIQLKYVSLRTPLATPNVAPATATPTSPPVTGP